MSLPPPPPGAYDTPPPPAPDDLSNIPPPAPEAEQHESDLLKRRKHFSWKKFGGEGFLVSVALHMILLILGLFWIVNKWREPAKKVEETFASGAGGGANGDKAKQFEHKMQRKQPMLVKTPSRIVSKSANASVSLTSTPTTSTSSFASGLSAGGMSKGSGGGSGGGEGTGIGIGKGNGKNYVSLFGSRGGGNNRLTGYIYDFMQTPSGSASPYKKLVAPSNCPWLDKVVSKFVREGWPQSTLDKCFRGPAQLGVTQILIPCSKDDAAPKAFEAEGKMVGGAWVAVYRGKVQAPESGEIRFGGTADNYLAVRFAGSNALYYATGNPKDSVIPLSPSKRYVGLRLALATGKWVSVTKGQWYDMEVLIGDAGGVFSGILYYEKKGAEGKKLLFRTEDNPFDDVLKMDDGHFFGGAGGDLPRDLDPASPVWQCKAPAASIR